MKTLEFKEPDADWVDFVCHCRRGGSQYKGYDLIIGGVADDKVYEAVSMYFKGLWDMETTLDALRFYEVNDQYCFVTQKAIDETLAFVASQSLGSFLIERQEADIVAILAKKTNATADEALLTYYESDLALKIEQGELGIQYLPAEYLADEVLKRKGTPRIRQKKNPSANPDRK